MRKLLIAKYHKTLVGDEGLTAEFFARLKTMMRERRLLYGSTISFSAASVIVTGYYPFFSEKTRNDFILKALIRRFFKIIPDTPTLTSKKLLERLTANSNEWYRASNNALSQAVRNVNSGLHREQVMFAKIEFSPEHSFAAPQTYLWQFNRSPFRMVLVLLSFGKILLPSNDETRKQRSASCKEFFKREPSETHGQKKEREQRRMLCRYAALVTRIERRVSLC